MFYTYILEGKDKKNGKPELYVGSTTDLQKRVEQHRAGLVQTTRKLENISLIYYEACTDKTDARKRELQLKTGFGRGYIKRRLENYFKTRVWFNGRTRPSQG